MLEVKLKRKEISNLTGGGFYKFYGYWRFKENNQIFIQEIYLTFKDEKIEKKYSTDLDKWYKIPFSKIGHFGLLNFLG
ncbi:hypothetical protein DRN73_05265 [Candidatus Pacearchaeota archaeon]|nr:MAG: hypothetical protein DRN73_05265 [Candidatus Pacearchaeota archaeon]